MSLMWMGGVALLACSRSRSTPEAALPALSSAPSVVVAARPPTSARNTRFDAKVDIAPFLAAGCIQAGGEGLLCPGLDDAGPALGCEQPLDVNDLLAGLTPRVAIAECKGDFFGVVEVGCMRRWYRRYVVASEGRLETVRTPSAFVKRFAPVDSPEEALAFALALTNTEAFFTIAIPNDAVLYPGHFEPTSVEKVDAGYLVHLFHYVACGCGPHDELAVDFLVTRAGDAKEVASRPVWGFPKQNGRCAD
jgi:hypothetical protein